MTTLSKKFLEALEEVLSDRLICPSAEISEDDCYSYNDVLSIDGHACKFSHGCTKGVFIFDDLDVVVKFPYSGSLEYKSGYSWDDDNGSHYSSSEEVFTRFESAGEESEDWNYCEREAALYQKAKTAGLEEFFCPSEKLYEVNGYPVYIQKKATSIGGSSNAKVPVTEEDNALYRKIEEYMDTRDSMKMSYNFIFNLVKSYSFEKFKEFYSFCKEEGINDLHSDNYGYCGEKPVLVDYSGYYEW